MAFLAVLGALVALPMVMFISSILNGYVLSILWGWFIVPTLGAPTLSTVPAIGIALVVAYLTYQVSDCEKVKREFSEEVERFFGLVVLRPLLTLLFGWAVHLFM